MSERRLPVLRSRFLPSRLGSLRSLLDSPPSILGFLPFVLFSLILAIALLSLPASRARAGEDHDRQDQAGQDQTGQEQAEQKTGPGLAVNAIDAAVVGGEISEGQAVLYKLYLLKGSSLLPKQYDLGGEHIRCGTEIVAEAQRSMPGFSGDLQREIQTYLDRPTLSDWLDTPHFRIHYATSGPNAIYLWPNTAYRDSIAAACERSYRIYREQGWQLPPGDGTSGGANGLIDCYVDNLSGVYGYTVAEALHPTWPDGHTAYFVIDNDYTGFNYADRGLPMKVTVAHEYHHVVQMGYTTGNRWWMEQMAVFMEDKVYDSVNDNYQYIFCYTQKPFKRLEFWDNCFPYACFLWPTLIEERTAVSAVRDIQACAATGDIWSCFDSVLSPSGLDLNSALAMWQVYNFYTWQRNDGLHYEEAAEYHDYLAYDLQVSSYPALGLHPTPSRLPEGGGASVMRLWRDTTSPHNKLTVTFTGPSCTKQVVVIAKEAGGSVFHEFYMDLDGQGNGRVDVNNWNTMEWAHMIVSMSHDCGAAGQDFSFDAATTQSVGVEDQDPPLYTRLVRLDQNAPNPFGPETFIGYRLEQEMPVHLAVFDASGRQVRALIQTTQASGSYTVRWDGRDDAGRAVQPGVYFYRLNAGAASEVRKMIVAG